MWFNLLEEDPPFAATLTVSCESTKRQTLEPRALKWRIRHRGALCNFASSSSVTSDSRLNLAVAARFQIRRRSSTLTRGRAL